MTCYYLFIVESRDATRLKITWSWLDIEYDTKQMPFFFFKLHSKHINFYITQEGERRKAVK